MKLNADPRALVASRGQHLLTQFLGAVLISSHTQSDGYGLPSQVTPVPPFKTGTAVSVHMIFPAAMLVH
jgi:hypothetical protein